VPHYAVPEPRDVTAAGEMRAAPLETSEQVGDVEAGAEFFLLDVIGDWGWGYRASDHLVGYVRTAHLSQ
jgi:hypothetical protein